MKKDVIYIDIEDDITSIIGKVKGADAKIVALVPPKRVGVLQSIVNLKLLQRAANSSDHRIVLITNNQALSSLAAGISIPVAKNLQSKPEIAPIAALDVDDEDIINGADLPVGDHARAAAGVSTADTKLDSDAAAAALSIDNVDTPIDSPSSIAAASSDKPAAKKDTKIPNFEQFRKKLVVGGIVGVGLIAFLIWAIFIAPHATITISAKTNSFPINQVITLDPSVAASDVQKGVFKPQVQQVKKSVSTQFTATGSKDIGQKATGTVTLSNANQDPVNIPAGTQFTSNGLQFTNDSAVSVPAGSCSGPIFNCSPHPGTATASITAVAQGPQYNLSGPVQFSSSVPNVSASSQQGTSGGTTQPVTVVSQDDVTKAQAQLATQNQDDVKNQLKKQFTGDVIMIDASFTGTPGAPTVTPNVGEQANGPATLSVETTYTMLAIPHADLKSYLINQLQPDVKPNQRIYLAGDAKPNFTQFQVIGTTFTTKLDTSGNIGPNIDTTKLKLQIQGKRYGEVQQIVSQYDGVDNVDVNLSPFWVTTVPGPNKTDIEFKVTNGN